MKLLAQSTADKFIYIQLSLKLFQLLINNRLNTMLKTLKPTPHEIRKGLSNSNLRNEVLLTGSIHGNYIT